MKYIKFTYWFTTVIFAFSIAPYGVGYLDSLPRQVAELTRLGYPEYFRYILGVCLTLGAIMIGIPSPEKIKEWVYAGFAFTLASAIFSHAYNGDLFATFRKPVILSVLLVISYITHSVLQQNRKEVKKEQG